MKRKVITLPLTLKTKTAIYWSKTKRCGKTLEEGQRVLSMNLEQQVIQHINYTTIIRGSHESTIFRKWKIIQVLFPTPTKAAYSHRRQRLQSKFKGGAWVKETRTKLKISHWSEFTRFTWKRVRQTSRSFFEQRRIKVRRLIEFIMCKR